MKALTTLTSIFVLAAALGCAPSDRLDHETLGEAGDKADEVGTVIPAWIGASGTDAPARVQFERSAPGPCTSGGGYGPPAVYDSWARQRASQRNLCFEVWAPGVTDWDNPDIWRQLDVQAHYRWRNSFNETTGINWVDHVGWVGNNAQYAFSMGWHDPFFIISSDSCPDVPLVEIDVRSDEWALVKAELLVYFTVNGVEHKPAWDNEGFRVQYEAFVKTSCVAEVP